MWIIFFLLAMLMAGLRFILAKEAMAGLPPAMVVAIDALVLMLLHFLSMNGSVYVSRVVTLPVSAWGLVFVRSLLLAGGWICFYIGLDMTRSAGMAAFSMLYVVFSAVIGMLTSFQLPPIFLLVSYIVLTVGIFLLGLGGESDKSKEPWWIPALLGPVFLSAYYFVTEHTGAYLCNSYVIFVIFSIVILAARRTTLRMILLAFFAIFGIANCVILFNRVTPFGFTDLNMVTDLLTMRNTG